MTVLSSLYGIIMDFAINTPGHGNNVLYGLNATHKRYLKEEMELMGKLETKDTTYIGMLSSASKCISVNFLDQCLYILNNKEILNGLKGSTKIQKRQSEFKYQSFIYNVQRKSDVNHRGMKMSRNKNYFHH